MCLVADTETPCNVSYFFILFPGGPLSTTTWYWLAGTSPKLTLTLRGHDAPNVNACITWKTCSATSSTSMYLKIIPTLKNIHKINGKLNFPNKMVRLKTSHIMILK